MIKVNLPLPTIKEKGKSVNLSLNKYRNAHYRQQNDSKKHYAEICRLNLYPYRKRHYERVRATFVLFNKTNRRRDLSNFCGMVDKVFCDVLTELNIIDDDDCNTLPEVRYVFGGIGEDKVTVIIEEVV